MEELERIYFKPARPKGFYLDPRTKILLMAYMSLSLMFFGKDLLIVSLLAAMPLVLLIHNRQYKIALIYGGLFVFGILCAVFHMNWTIHPVLNAIVVLLVALVVRLFPAFLLGYYIIESTSVRDFIAAMKRWHISEKFIIPVSVVFRFLPTIREESTAIKRAMKMRDIQFGNKQFWKNPGLYLEYRVVPLMISIAKIGEELSAAAITRGLSVGVKRTSVAIIRFGVYDVLALAICVSITIFGIFRSVIL